MKSPDKELLINILAEEAFVSGVGVLKFFHNLILSADLPQPMQMEAVGGLHGNPVSDARFLVNYMWTRGTVRPGMKALGLLLQPVMATAGIEKNTWLASLIISYNLLSQHGPGEDVGIRFQVPAPLDLKTIAYNEEQRRGAPIEWDLPDDEKVLQNLFVKEPDFLDVGLLRKAVDRSRSVCRIEVGANGSRGTGVLVGDDLILTNWHVLGCTVDVADSVARTIIARFGAYTESTVSGQEGQPVKLHASSPVVSYSPVAEHDFALLRIALDERVPRDLCIVPINTELPKKGDTINILQHPDGGVMKLGLAANGVTAVHGDRGLVRYITRTSGGSSGAPCFDVEWKLVALHHAEISRAIGSVREGVMMAAIHSAITEHL